MCPHTDNESLYFSTLVSPSPLISVINLRPSTFSVTDPCLKRPYNLTPLCLSSHIHTCWLSRASEMCIHVSHFTEFGTCHSLYPLSKAFPALCIIPPPTVNGYLRTSTTNGLDIECTDSFFNIKNSNCNSSFRLPSANTIASIRERATTRQCPSTTCNCRVGSTSVD